MRTASNGLDAIYRACLEKPVDAITSKPAHRVFRDFSEVQALNAL